MSNPPCSNADVRMKIEEQFGGWMRDEGKSRVSMYNCPPSPRPSPPGEGESFSVSCANQRLDWSSVRPNYIERAKVSPSPGGPRIAKRFLSLGHLPGGGLGKPLGKGEGGRYTNFAFAPGLRRFPGASGIIRLNPPLSGIFPAVSRQASALIRDNPG